MNRAIFVSWQLEPSKTLVFSDPLDFDPSWSVHISYNVNSMAQYYGAPDIDYEIVPCPTYEAVKMLREAVRPIRTIVEIFLVINPSEDE